MPTNVPSPSFGPTGFIAPTAAAVLAGVLADLNAAFGGGLNPALNTPQGQLATSLTAIIDEVNDTFLFYTQQVDPAYAEGRMQDALGRIYNIERNPSEPTVVQALCSGLAGVAIPAGALALAQDGNIYTCTEAGTIPVSGNITLAFSCNVVGPVQCPANTLTVIYQVIPGWDTVNNPSDGVVGVDVESRQAFELRRQQSLQVNSLGQVGSVQGAVLSVSGVLDAYVVDNPLGTTATVGGVTLAAHSVYVAAVGGATQDIANAIWSKKSLGCNYNGNTTVTVTDTTSYSPPFPSYSVTFEIPTPLPTQFAVRLTNNAQVPSNATALIQQAIISAFAGGDGLPRARIGATIYASRFYAAISALGAWVQLISILLSNNNTAAATASAGSISGTTFTAGGSVVGTIAIGQTLQDDAGNILPGTTIVSGSGTSWVVNNSQTVASTKVYCNLPTAADVTVNINQVPVVSVNDIAVTLV